MFTETERIGRIQALAEETFGDAEKSKRWLARPLAVLHKQTPRDVARTEAGGKLVENILARIAWGAAV